MYKILILASAIIATFTIYTNPTLAESFAVLQDNGFRNLGNVLVSNNNISDYNYSKIAEAEEYLFGENFASQNLMTRLERLEDNIFGRRYTNTSIEQRVNNIIYNYNRNANSNTTYKKTKFRNIIDGLNQTFFGVPTGYTPPIYTNPYYNWDDGSRYGSYNDYYGHNGWHRYNTGVNTGSRIRIID